MTFRRMSRGFVCSSQRDKERDLNKSIYPCWPSTQPTFCPECSQCCAAGWHHETSQQPKSAMGLSFPIILGASAGCTSLGPWPEGRCWALGRESHCKAVAVDERCSLESSLLLPFLEHSFSSKLTHTCLGYKVPGMVRITFSLCQPVVDILPCRAGEVYAPPGWQCRVSAT